MIRRFVWLSMVSILASACAARGPATTAPVTRIWPPAEYEESEGGTMNRPSAKVQTAATHEIVPASTPTPTVPAVVDQRTFDPAVVRPDAGSSEHVVRVALDERKYEVALRAAKSALRSSNHDTQGRLLWMAARAARSSGQGKDASTYLRTLAATTHPLSRWAKVALAETMVSSAPRDALALAEQVSDSWAGQSRALAVVGLCEIAFQRTTAQQTLELAIQLAPTNDPATEASFALAEMYKRDERTADAAKLYARVTRIETRSSQRVAANRALQSLRSKLGEEQYATIAPEIDDDEPVGFGSQTPPAPAAAAWKAGVQRFREKNYTRTAQAMQAVAKRFSRGDYWWCRANELRSRALLLQRNRSEGAPLSADVADACTAPSLRNFQVWARYRAARGYHQSGDPRNAIKQYDKLSAEAPTHRLADDAMFRSSVAHVELGEPTAAMELLRKVPDAFPNGDMWSEALFELAWLLRKRGEHSDALAILDELLFRGPTEASEGMSGRAAYWRADALIALDQLVDAKKAFASVAKQWPLRYYGQLAVSRLAEIDEDRATRLVHAMRESGPTRLVFAWKPTFEDEGFSRAIALLRTGDSDLAAVEMEALGIVGEHADPQLTVLGTVLFERASGSDTLQRITRKRVMEIQSVAPVGDARILWEAAYPMAFNPMIEHIARDEGVPPAFVRAIAREESGFDPVVVSWAHAHGLLQLMLPTARRFGRGLSTEITKASLQTPEVNIRIGARYMKWLRDRLSFNAALVPAAYNAGEGSVGKWLKVNVGNRLDEFIEEIPYEETQRYTRRVLQTYGVYQWLENQTLPPLRNMLNPARASRPTSTRVPQEASSVPDSAALAP